MSVRYAIHQMIQDLNANPEAAEAYRADPKSVTQKYNITDAEHEALIDGSLEAMTELGVHPNLQLKWLRIRSVGVRPDETFISYLNRFLET